jgi:hypothetical protein
VEELSSASAISIPTETRPYADRSTGLVIFGVGQVCLGFLAGLGALATGVGALGSIAHLTHSNQPAQLLAALFFYLSCTVVLCALGAGSIRKRRWARTLTLVGSCYGLVAGIFVTVFLIAVLPALMRGQLAQAKTGGTLAIMAIILTVIISACAFFFVVIPLAFVLFYSRKDVEWTCRHYDPVERWTDRLPMPVLAASLINATAALYLFLVCFTSPPVPFFAIYLTGGWATAWLLTLGALDGYLAIQLYKMRLPAWWVAVCSVAIRIASLVLTLIWGDPLEGYADLGWSQPQLRKLAESPLHRGHIILWWGIFSLAIYFGFLLWLKPYFRASEENTAGEGPVVTTGFIAQAYAAGPSSSPAEGVNGAITDVPHVANATPAGEGAPMK